MAFPGADVRDDPPYVRQITQTEQVRYQSLMGNPAENEWVAC
jgi:hypothetical protein